MDMVEHAEAAMVRMERRDAGDLVENQDLAWVIERLLITVGEGARRVPDEVRDHIDLPWRSIVGMRNIVTHDYGNVDKVAVAETVHQRLPGMVAAIHAFLSTNP